MPLSDIDLAERQLGLEYVGVAITGPIPSGANIAVLCHECGYTVETNRDDVCDCKNVIVDFTSRTMTVRSSAEVFRLVPAA